MNFEYKKAIMDLFKDPLYQSVDECTTEKVVRDITNGKELRRIDIWMNVSIAVGEEKLVVPVIVENKVYASENGDQTKAYHEAMDTFCQRKNLSGAKCLPIEIYLAPEGTAKPSAESRRRNRIQYG